MAVLLDQKFPMGTEHPDYNSQNQEADEYRLSLIAKVLFLIDNVAPEHKNPLIKSKIINQGYEKFNLARSHVEGDAYYRQFISALSTIALEKLLLTLKPGLELNARSNQQTEHAYNYAYEGKPIPKPALAVEQAYVAFSGVFRDTLDAEAKRQYEAAVHVDPGHILEHHELEKCGRPLNAVFKTYLSKLPGEDQRKFNFIIRKTIRDPQLSTYEVQVRLRHTAKRLADALENRDLKQDAYNVRAQVFSRAFADESITKSVMNKRSKRKQQKPTMLRGLLDYASSMLRGVFNNFASTLRNVLENLGLQPNPPPAPKKAAVNPKASVIAAHDDLTASKHIQDFSARMAKLQNQAAPSAKTELLAPALSLDPKRDLTYAFRARNKVPPYPLPELSGPHTIVPKRQPGIHFDK